MSPQLTSATQKPWVRGLTRPFRKHAVIALVLGLLTTCCAALLMFVSGYLICRTAQPETTLFMVMVPVALVQVFGIVRPFARYFERLASHDWVFRVTSSLRMLLFSSARAQAGDPASERAIGEFLEFLTDDIAHLQNLYLRVSFPTTVAFLLIVVGAVFCGVFAPALGLAFLCFSVITAVFAPLAARLVAKPLQKRAKASMSREYVRLADDIIGATDWALADRVDEVRNLHERDSARALREAAAVRRAVRVAELVAAAIAALGACAITAIAGDAFHAKPNNVNFIAAFALGIFPVIETFAFLPHAFTDSLSHEDSLERLDGVIGQASNSKQDAAGKPCSADSANTAVFSSVTYRYPGNATATISDLDLVVPSGQKIAVLGRSGSGKTTLARLLRGTVAPTEGTVSVCGSPAASINADAPLIGYIPQAPHLFDDTLRNNLLLAKPQASDDELVSALETVGLSEKFKSLANELDEVIGEAGTSFSGGEAHRLALARALLADNPVILLDEPFNALDPVTEASLLESLFTAFDDKTLIVITHHLANIERFDRVVFLENGRLQLDGPPHDLARDEPYFKRLLDFDR